MKRIPYIFYNNSQKDEQGRNTGFFGFNTGDELTLAYAGTIEVRDNVLCSSLKDQLFEMFNVDELRPADYRGPSMSVGDVIVIGHNLNLAYAVESCGFKDVTLVINDSPVKMHPARWIS
jgi:YodL-like